MVDAAGLAQRRWRFWGGCVPTRLLIALALLMYPQTWMAVPLAAMALGIALIWALGWRRTGPEVNGEHIWWDRLRPLHALLWGAAALLVWSGSPRSAGLLVLADVVIGAVATSMEHARIQHSPTMKT